MVNKTGNKLSELEMDIIVHNIRSVNGLVNRHASSALLAQNLPHLLVLTESWLDETAPKLHQKYDSFQSPKSKHEGVVIYYRKEMVIFPIREDWWTPNFVIAQINQTAIIGVYLNPLNK